MQASGLKAVVLTLILCGGARADGPWKEKPSKDWDRADIRKILYDSPWVKHFVRSKRDMEFDVPDKGPSGMELRGYHAKESKEEGGVTTEFYVRWVSSRTVRRAWARRRALGRPSEPEEAACCAISSPPSSPPMLDDFEVAVAGRDMSSFDNVKEAALRKKCFLQTGSSVRRITPSGVEIARSSEGRVRGLLFHFPRRTASGDPTISAHETKVWFIEYASDVEVRATFYPQTMVDWDGVDL